MGTLPAPRTRESSEGKSVVFLTARTMCRSLSVTSKKGCAGGGKGAGPTPRSLSHTLSSQSRPPPPQPFSSSSLLAKGEGSRKDVNVPTLVSDSTSAYRISALVLGRESNCACSTGLRYLPGLKNPPGIVHADAEEEEAREEFTLQHSHAVAAGSVAAVAAAKSVRLELDPTENVALAAGSTAKSALGMVQSESTKAPHLTVSTSPRAGLTGKRSVKGLCTAG